MPIVHTIVISDLPNHPFFSLQVKCSCGTTLYAKDIIQAKQHKEFHEGHVKRLEALDNGK